ncbi:MAG: hypothetical protein ACI364_03230 [Coriobacteriales bacterium]
MIIVPVVCGLLGLAASFVLVVANPTYQAKASVSASAQIAPVLGVAKGIIQTADVAGVTMSAASDSTSSTVTITAEGPDPDSCVSAVNDAIYKTNNESKESFSNISTNVVYASSAENISRKWYVYPLVAFFVGLFAVICVMVILDMRDPRIHSKSGALAAAGIPCMGTLDGNLAERQRLLTTVRLVGREGEPAARSICIIPAGVSTSAEKAASQLDRIATGQHVEITSAPALDKGARPLLRPEGGHGDYGHRAGGLHRLGRRDAGQRARPGWSGTRRVRL